MLVKLKAECRQALNAVSTKIYPAGWSGQVPDELALKWIEEGKAEPVINEQTVLADITKAVKAEAEAAAQETPAPAQVQGPGEAGEISLDELTLAELRQVASEARIEGASRMKKADLVVILKQRLAAADERAKG